MDSKSRFSSRVDNYVKYRPGYPARIIDTLRQGCELSPAWRVADIGSGTGLLARLFLDFGCPVTGVEPNDEMRQAGERLLAAYPRFASRGGSAEDTGLPPGSVELVTAGQAFHWFDPPAARAEFRRILVPGGWAALVWNERQVTASGFLRDYEDLLLAYADGYREVDHRNVQHDPRAIPLLFGGAYAQARFDNLQMFDFEGVKGRLLSSSYAPEPGHPNHAPMLAELQRIFERWQQGGQVAFAYDTHLYYGQVV